MTLGHASVQHTGAQDTVVHHQFPCILNTLCMMSITCIEDLQLVLVLVRVTMHSHGNMGKKFVLFTNYNGSLLRRQPGGQGVTLVMALSLEVASTCVQPEGGTPGSHPRG